MKNRRRKKLIKPHIQLGLSARFLGISLMALLLQAMLMSSLILRTADTMPIGGRYLVDRSPDLFWQTLGVSMLVILPATLLVGVVSTFGIVGPIYRFEQYLKAIVAGEPVGECRIRSGDSLQELCELINQVTDAQRKRRSESPEDVHDVASTSRVA